MVEIKTHSAQETVKVAFELGKFLIKGDIVCLNGDLGAGKTAFTYGIAKALGIEEYITSPTFTIVNEYAAEIPFYHFDVYRVADIEEMYELGFEEYIDGNGIVVIEWAETIKDILPEDRISVFIEKAENNDDERSIKIDFMGKRSNDCEKEFLNSEGIDEIESFSC